MSESQSELDDFVSVLNDSLASILDKSDRKVTHVSEGDLESKEYSSTDGQLIVDLKNGHKRVIVDAEEALALRRELGGVAGGRPIPFGVVGKAQDGSWWVLAEIGKDVDGGETLRPLSGQTVEAGFRRVAELAEHAWQPARRLRRSRTHTGLPHAQRRDDSAWQSSRRTWTWRQLRA